MHILIIPSEEFVPEYAKLSGIFQLDQALALRAKGIEVGVISVTDSIAIKTTLITVFRKLTFRKIFYKVLEENSVLSMLYILIKQILKVKSVIREVKDGIFIIRIQRRCWTDIAISDKMKYFNRCIATAIKIYIKEFGKPSLIHAHNAWFAGIAAMEIEQRDKIPYCITEHSTYYARELIPTKFNPLIRKVFKHSKQNIMVSTSLGQLLAKKELLDADYIDIPNILDPKFQLGIPNTATNENGRFTFLNIAELTEKKGHSFLIKAFANKFAKNNNVKLVIGGDGGMRRELQTLAESLNINDQVTFTGVLGRDEVLAQMYRCNVFVLPSLVETFGVVLIEAMACGKPVIATKCGGPEVFVNENNGILIEPGNVYQLAETMFEFYTAKRHYDQLLIREFALQNFGSDKVSDTLINVYKRIINE